MRRTASLLLALILLATLFTGCGNDSGTSEPETTPPSEDAQPGTRSFVDSTGRELEIPADISRIAVTGQMTQIVIFALAPEKLVGLSGEWSEGEREFIPAEFRELPVLGQLYGGKSEMNLESLIAAAPQIVIDIGESKDSMVQDMDKLTEQSGIPFIHIDASLSTYDEMYKTLGALLGMEEEAGKLADYCQSAYSTALEISQGVNKANMLYVVGDNGLNVIVKDSYHSEMLDLLCNNLAVVDNASSKGTGNEVDMEQILSWNPDYIIFESQNACAMAKSDSSWSAVKAIEDGNFYIVPSEPYNWLGFPPSVQRSLGLLWMAKLFYPDETDYDMYEQAREFYQLFYHSELTPEQYNSLTGRALGTT